MAILEEEGRIIKQEASFWLHNAVIRSSQHASAAKFTVPSCKPSILALRLALLPLVVCTLIGCLLLARYDAQRRRASEQLAGILHLSEQLVTRLPTILQIQIPDALEKMEVDYKTRSSKALDQAKITLSSFVRDCLPMPQLFVINQQQDLRTDAP